MKYFAPISKIQLSRTATAKLNRHIGARINVKRDGVAITATAFSYYSDISCSKMCCLGIRNKNAKQKKD
jgi:hypothetical protein